ncbi:MAG: C25 family cysteine peptidase [Candidatus Krumholzibacteriia bacterium]
MISSGVRPQTFKSALLLSLCLLWSASALAAAGNEQVLFEGSFAPHELTWTQDAAGNLVPVLPGTRELGQPGLPNVPVREILLLVPMDQEVVSLQVEPLRTHREKLAGPLAVAAPQITDSGEAVMTVTMEKSGAVFPAQWGTFQGSHLWRGYQLVAVEVYPVREVTGSEGAALEFLDAYAVKAVLAGRLDAPDHARRERFVPGEAEANAEILGSLVANPDAIVSYRRENGQVVPAEKGGFQPTATPSLSGSGVSYLIITSEALESEFQRLADHKTAQGLPTVVVTREYIAANYRNGSDIQETMRMFARDAYQMWGVEYLLLGGDTDILPPRYVDNSYYPTVGSTLIPVDLYFACLDGNWNANANSEYGEPAAGADLGDQCDFAEELYVGRATVSTMAQAATFVDKIIAYESTPAGAGWPDRVLFAAEVLFPADFDVQGYISLDGAQFAHQQVQDLIIPCTDMEYMRMYETNLENPWDVPLTRRAFIDTVNTGNYGIINQIGHGYYFNMSLADQNFMTTDADALVNGDHLFLIYALNCASAAFDNSCLLERFVQNPNGGSICSLGSARAAFPYNSNNYQQEFFEQLYCHGEFRVGRVMALSRLPFIGATANNYVDRWTFENYTLIGDPSLPIWTSSPDALSLSRPSSLDLGQQTVNVTVSTGGTPVSGALVCLEMDGVDYAMGVTDALGQVALDFLAGRTGSAVLKVSGRNLAQATAVIPVTAATPYVTLDAMAVADDGSVGSIGNGNGMIESGETVALTATILETGGGALNNLSGTLTPLDPGATVLTPSVSFPNVAAFGSATATGPFLVAFDPGVADGTTLGFRLDVTNGVSTVPSRYEVTIKAPEVEAVSLDWQDATYGNGNGMIDSTERLVVTVNLKNYGFGTADGFTGRLRTSDLNMVLYDSLATWSGLEHMEENAGSPTYSLSLTNATRNTAGWILFTDNYGRTFRHDFTLQRPDSPTVITTNTSEGADVILLKWDPPLATDVLGYHVYRSFSALGPFSRVNEDLVAGTSYFRDEGLDLLTQYYYKIVAVDSSLVPSAYSAAIAQSTAPANSSGYPVSYGLESSSHPAVGDVDGDGDNEIVVASDEVYVWHHDGTELLDGDGNSQTLGPFTDFASDFEPAGVVLAQLDQSPGLEMIVSQQATSQIRIFRHDGSELPGWPVSTGGVAGTTWNWATPAVGDIDGDGEPEIVVATLNGRIWAWNVDGTEVIDGDANPATMGILYYRPGSDGEWSMSAPALYDLDGDGAKDLIFGTRSDATGLKRLMAIRYDGTDLPGFPIIVSGPVGCSPAVADLNNDGMVEIIIFTGWKVVYVIQADGSNYPGFPKGYPYGSTLSWVTSPGVGDLDADGQLEIVLTTNVSGLESWILAYDTNVGSTSGTLMTAIQLPGSTEGSPVIGDIDGDGSPEILQGIGGGDENAPDAMYAFHADGSSVAGFPISLDGPGMTSPVICDLDKDSDVDIVYAAWGRKVSVWDMPFAFDAAGLYWPTFHGNMQRDGVYRDLGLSDVPRGSELPPSAFVVEPPYPNPFNPSTTVQLYVPQGSGLELAVFDLKGRLVRSLHSGEIGSGWHRMIWDGQDDRGSGQASGVYFLRAVTTAGTRTHKLTLVK